MQNRVTVTVGGLKYTLLATEGEEYVHRVAAYVDEKLRETAKAGGSSQMGCAVLTAVNIADERFKEREASENLRRQLAYGYTGGAEPGAPPPTCRLPAPSVPP